MKIEDLLPAMRVGRRARRSSWIAGHHVMVDTITGARSNSFTMKDGASEHTWPGSQLEARDMLMDDWELLASPEYEANVPRNFRDAFDVVFSMMSTEVFDAFYAARKGRTYGSGGVEGLKSDSDWRPMGRECLEHYMEAAAAKDEAAKRTALARACIASLKALSYFLAEEYVGQIMTR